MKNFTLSIILLFVWISQSTLTAQETWTKVGAGTEFSMALKSDGTLWGSGASINGELGADAEQINYDFFQIGDDNDWVDFETGSFQTLALKSDGTLWGIGLNSLGQLGLGDTPIIEEFTQIGEDNDWQYIESGPLNSAAIKSDGTLWVTGNNFGGQLGTGDNQDLTELTQLGTDNDWAAIKFGYIHTLALKTDGSLWAWGFNANGQVGNNTIDNVLTPTKLGDKLNWTEIGCGLEYSAAIQDDGSLWTWGFNGNGQLGIGNIEQRIEPTQVEGDNWSELTVGALVAYAKSDGVLYSWGFNGLGQLGHSAGETAISTPTEMPGSWKNIASADGNIVQQSILGFHTIGISEDDISLCGIGGVYAGQLGSGEQTEDFISEIECGIAPTIHVSVSDIDHKYLDIYPNPSNGIFHLTTENIDYDSAEYTINSLDGKILKSWSRLSDQIDLSHFQAGIYLLTIRSENSIISKKVNIIK